MSALRTSKPNRLAEVLAPRHHCSRLRVGGLARLSSVSASLQFVQREVRIARGADGLDALVLFNWSCHSARRRNPIVSLQVANNFYHLVLTTNVISSGIDRLR